jgi:amino acid transporter
MATFNTYDGGSDSSPERKITNTYNQEPKQYHENVDSAAEYHEDNTGHSLHRGLKARQITMIAIGGAIGTGLIIGT